MGGVSDSMRSSSSALRPGEQAAVACLIGGSRCSHDDSYQLRQETGGESLSRDIQIDVGFHRIGCVARQSLVRTNLLDVHCAFNQSFDPVTLTDTSERVRWK